MKPLRVGQSLAVGAALILALPGCFLGGHQRLSEDPFAEQRAAASLALYSVDWWKQVVTDVPPLEYAPREPAAPAVDRVTHQVVVLTRDGEVRSYSSSGKLLWTQHTNGRFLAGAAFKGAATYVAGGDGVLYAFKTTSGEKLWQYDTSEELASSISFMDNVLLVASQTDSLFAVDATTGAPLWHYRRDTPNGFTIRGVSSPTVQDGAIYIGFSDGHLVALNAKDGSVKWDKTLSTGPQFIDVDATPLLDEEGHLYVASYKDGLFSLDPETGDVRWHRAATGITQLSRLGQMLIATGDERVSAYTLQSGAPIWSAPLGQRAGRMPALVEGYLLVPTAKALLFLDPITGRTLLTFDPGKGVSATPGVAGREIYVLSNLGYLYAFRMKTRKG